MRWLRQIVQHLMNDDGVGRAIGQRHVVDVAVADLGVRQARRLELERRIGQHRLVDVEAEAALVATGQHLQHAAGTRAEVDQGLERRARERRGDGGFDRGLGHVERADAVPVGRMLAEIGLGSGLALVLQSLGAGAVTAQDGVAGIDGIQQAAHEPAALRPVRDVKIDPAPFTETLDQAGFRQELQMSADARLALAQDLGQILDVELTGRQQQEDPETRALGRRLEGEHEVMGF